MQQTSSIIFDFTQQSDITLWRVVDDVVMGGVSRGNFKINNEGNGFYYGDISTDNNGGFSSLRYRFKQIDVSKFTKVILLLKGDGKKYQFRIKNKYRNYYSYIQEFTTNGSWQKIEIEMSNMYPAFRGRRLDIGNFSSNTIEEIAILIGNKKEERFNLEIDKIYLQ